VWSYIDARDLGQICDLAIGKSGMFPSPMFGGFVFGSG
jgi:hypothetical protein